MLSDWGRKMMDLYNLTEEEILEVQNELNSFDDNAICLLCGDQYHFLDKKGRPWCSQTCKSEYLNEKEE